MSQPLFRRNLNLCLFFSNLKQVQIICKTKLNHANIKATGVYSLVKLTNIYIFLLLWWQMFTTQFTKLIFFRAISGLLDLKDFNYFHFSSRVCHSYLWTQEVNWVYTRRSEDGLYVFWTAYVRLIFVMCSGLFVQNRAEYRNWENNITNLQTNIIYCHINGLKIQWNLITSFEHVLLVKILIYELLLCSLKWEQIFQTFKGFSDSFNKHD